MTVRRFCRWSLRAAVPGMLRNRAIIALPLAIGLTACGAFLSNFAESDCSLRPVGQQGLRLRIGPTLVTASCGAAVEVNGRTYGVGVGRWLDEASLELVEAGAITRANTLVDAPMAFSLPGVDPTEFLVIRGSGTDDLGEMDPFMALWGDIGGGFPDGLCDYADADDAQLPQECRGAVLDD